MPSTASAPIVNHPVFNVLNLFRACWFLNCKHLMSLILAAVKGGDNNDITWIDLLPSAHTHLLCQAKALAFPWHMPHPIGGPGLHNTVEPMRGLPIRPKGPIPLSPNPILAPDPCLLLTTLLFSHHPSVMPPSHFNTPLFMAGEISFLFPSGARPFLESFTTWLLNSWLALGAKLWLEFFLQCCILFGVHPL